MFVVETAVTGDIVKLRTKLISLARSALLNERRLIWPQTSKKIFFAPALTYFWLFCVCGFFSSVSCIFQAFDCLTRSER